MVRISSWAAALLGAAAVAACASKSQGTWDWSPWQGAGPDKPAPAPAPLPNPPPPPAPDPGGDGAVPAVAGIDLVFDIKGPNSEQLVTRLQWNHRVITIASHVYGGGEIPPPTNVYDAAGGDEERMYGLSANDMAGRVEQVIRAMRSTIGDPLTFNGYVVHDIEHWGPYFRRFALNDQNSHESAFRNMLMARYPSRLQQANGQWLTGLALQVAIENEWQKASRAWAGSLLAETRRRIPRGRQGWYHVPLWGYWDADNPGVNAEMRRIHEEQLSWYWPMVDLLCPNAYERYEIIPTGAPRLPWQIWAADDLYLKRRRAAEVRRLADILGKPEMWYLDLFLTHWQLPFHTLATDLGMQNTIQVFREYRPQTIDLWNWTGDGAPGVISLYNTQIVRWENVLEGL